MYSIRDSAAMFWGKVRRTFLIKFRKRRVDEMLSYRRGACSRCGACCKLLLKCPAYDDSDGTPKCLVYNDRPGVCGLFPLDAKDLRERNMVMPERECGFTFADTPNGKEVMESMPLRWGPPKRGTAEDIGTGNGKPRILKGGLAVVWAYFNRQNRKENGGGNGHP